jgi:hypothetical protein
MARLIINAIAEDTIAKPGNALDSFLVSGVTAGANVGQTLCTTIMN